MGDVGQSEGEVPRTHSLGASSASQEGVHNYASFSPTFLLLSEVKITPTDVITRKTSAPAKQFKPENEGKRNCTFLLMVC